jgi:phage FluMu protein Com
MATVSKLTCPECGKVLRPAKPLAIGKKVKCPRCETVFVAVEDEEEVEARPARARDEGRARKDGAGKPPAPKPARKKAEAKKPAREEIGTYGYVKEDEDPEDRPQIYYGHDTSIKDLRGPARTLCVKPSNLLLICGLVGAIGWLVLILMLVIPKVFPITEGDVTDYQPWGAQPAATAKAAKKKEPGFYEIWGMDAAHFTKKETAAWVFILSLIPLALGFVYSGLTAFGGVQMQNLESRRWAMAGSIMAMIPLNMGGVIILVGLLTNFLFLSQLEMDAGYTTFLVILFTSIVWLLSLAVGVRCLLILNDEDVIAGFEYVPDQ